MYRIGGMHRTIRSCKQFKASVPSLNTYFAVRSRYPRFFTQKIYLNPQIISITPLQTFNSLQSTDSILFTPRNYQPRFSTSVSWQFYSRNEEIWYLRDYLVFLLTQSKQIGADVTCWEAKKRAKVQMWLKFSVRYQLLFRIIFDTTNSSRNGEQWFWKW